MTKHEFDVGDVICMIGGFTGFVVVETSQDCCKVMKIGDENDFGLWYSDDYLWSHFVKVDKIKEDNGKS